MRWLGLLLLIVVWVLLPTPVLADTSDDVVITASGYICGAPGNFTLIYVSDYEIGISWEKGEDAENTMVRAAFGRIPDSRTDGYLVYSGNGTSCTDAALSLASPEVVYYVAWSQNAEGIWSPLSALGDTEEFMSASFLFIGFILIAGLLTFFALKVSLLLFRLAAGMSWLGLGIWLFLSDSTNLQMSDAWTQVLGLVFVMMAIAVVSLQFVTDVRHERSVRGKQGYPGATTESWSGWGPRPKEDAESRSAKVYREHKERMSSVRRHK